MDPRIVAGAIVVFLLVLLWYWLSIRSDSSVFQSGYFDYNATTPMYPEAKKAWLEASKLGNAHASYANKARQLIEKSRQIVLQAVGADPSTHTVIWTSGGSESNNLILRGMAEFTASNAANTARPHFILSETEHKTSLECAKQLEQAGKIELTILPVMTNTFVCPYTMMNALKPNTRLVSIMHINNESGVINNLSAYGQILDDFSKKQGLDKPIIFHTDAVQSLGKMPPSMVSMRLHAVSFSAHKFGGPLGCGGLIISRELNARLAPQINGSQNYGLRGGTENTPGIAATGVALDISLTNREHKNKRLAEKKSRITQRLQQRFPLGNYASYVGKPDTLEVTRESDAFGQFRGGYQIVPMGAPENSTAPNTLWFSIVRNGPLAEHFCNLKLQKDLERNEYIVSVGSACNTGKGSHVLQAIKAPYIIRCGIVRVSLGDQTTEDECDGLVDAIIHAVAQQ